MTEPVGQVWRELTDLVAAIWRLPAIETLGVVVTLLLGLVIATVGIRRLTGGHQQRRRAALEAEVRPLLLEVLAEDDPDPVAVQRLAGLPRRQWRSAEPMLLLMVGKVRGGARDALIEALAQRGALARAARRTTSRSVIRRCRGAALGAARRAEHVPILVGLLDDPNSEVRRVSVRALGHIGSRDAAESLLHAVSGSRPSSPTDVSAALVLLEPAATAVLARAAVESAPVEQAVAAEVLGLRGAVQSGPSLMRLLQGSDDVEVQVRAARALGRIGSPAAVGPLEHALDSPLPGLRAVAARALGQLGAVASIDALTRCLGDREHRVAANAAGALARLGQPGQDRLLESSTGTDARAAGHAREALAMLALDAPTAVGA